MANLPLKNGTIVLLVDKSKVRDGTGKPSLKVVLYYPEVRDYTLVSCGENQDHFVTIGNIRDTIEQIVLGFHALKRDAIIKTDETLATALSNKLTLIALVYGLLADDCIMARKSESKIDTKHHKKFHSVILKLSKALPGKLLHDTGNRTEEDLNELERQMYDICILFYNNRKEAKGWIQQVNIINDQDWLPALYGFIQTIPEEHQAVVTSTLSGIAEWVTDTECWWFTKVGKPAQIVKFFASLETQYERSQPSSSNAWY